MTPTDPYRRPAGRALFAPHEAGESAPRRNRTLCGACGAAIEYAPPWRHLDAGLDRDHDATPNPTWGEQA